jgi:hypothetical protein
MACQQVLGFRFFFSLQYSAVSFKAYGLHFSIGGELVVFAHILDFKDF